MEIIFITVPVTLLFIATGVGIFFWANKGGQFDDLDSPAHRILFDDDVAPNQDNTSAQVHEKNTNKNQDSTMNSNSEKENANLPEKTDTNP